MEISRMRLLAVTLIAGILIAGGVVAPASAASPFSGDTTVITLKGHVTDPAGKAITGITVVAGCPCGGVSGTYLSGKDTTSSTGLYSFKIQKQYAPYISFTDPKDRYFGSNGDKKKAVSVGYIVNATMKRVSVISGTVTAINGGRAHFTQIRFYDAITGKGKGNAFAHANGTYEGLVTPGPYKIKFGGGNLYTNETWYGGVATSAESPTVTVAYAGTVTGVDATVTPTPTITGTVTVDGEPALPDVAERLEITIADGNGTRVGKTVSNTGFSFARGLTAGTYTISARATDGSSNYVQPLTQAVTLAPGTAIRGLVLKLASNPVSSASTRSAGIAFDQTSKGIAKSGEVLKGKIIVSSYASVEGGKALIYVNGVKVDSRMLPASGRLNWRERPAKVVVGGFHPFRVKVRFLGTDTTRARSLVVYALGGD